MITLALTHDDFEYAKAEREKRDHLNDYFERPGRDIRWTGLAVERVIDRWLSEVGIEHVWNGGVDRLPDFDVGGVGVAVKNNNGKWRYDFDFMVPNQVTNRLDDQILFTVLDLEAALVHLAGLTTNEQFRLISRFARKGEPGPVRELFNDCRIVRADQLLDPLLWARMMGGSI